MTRLRKILTVGAAATMLAGAVATSTPASAQWGRWGGGWGRMGWGPGWGGGWGRWGWGGGWGRGWGWGGATAAGLLGGLALGAAASAPYWGYGYGGPWGYYGSAYPYGYGGGCSCW
ncbi:MAG TPA: hypothetical protein VIF34_13535 [Methylocystis sp.]|jgi:hypothetical protein